MNYTLPDHKRAHTPGEEIANCVSHGVGLAGGLAAGPFLVLAASRHGGAADIAGAVVFAGTVVLLYLSSTLYHAFPRNRAKSLFRVIDHSAIYLLIAGTYTPFTLGVLRGAWGWTLFGLVWSVAALGITLKVAGGIRYPKLSTVLYIVMGWIAVIAIRPLWQRMPVSGMAVDNSWRTRVHRGHHFLRRRSAGQVWPFRVAFVCSAGNSLSLLRGAVVCDLVRDCGDREL